MRATLAALLWLLQLAPLAQRDRGANPSFQPFQRAVLLHAGSSGQVCVALDATVFAHAGDRSAKDLRLYRVAGQDQTEVPYAMTESSAGTSESGGPGDSDTAELNREQVHADTVELDLHMPDRAFSAIDLKTGIKDFIAVARVTGSETLGGAGRDLGTVTIFNFNGEGLPGSTELRLGESRLPWVHLHVRLLNANGGRLERPLPKPVFTGAEVPPSREAQVLYTPVAETQVFRDDGQGAIAELHVPAHVPVERIRVELNSHFRADFNGRLEIEARPQGSAASGSGENVTAGLGRIERADPGPGVPAIHYQQLSAPLALGVNLRTAASLTVQLRGVARSAGPVASTAWKAVLLEMRQRGLCFEATAGTKYVLRYGDPLLPAPAYPYAQSFVANAHAIEAGLGPEERNPAYRRRGEANGFLRRNPELLWVMLIAVIGLAGALVTERMRRQGDRR